MAGAEALVSFVVENLGTFLVDQAVLLGSVRGKVEQLKTELEMMQCYLSDADRRRNDNPQIKKCLADITDLAYDADEVIETFVVKVAGEAVGRRPPAPVCFDFKRSLRFIKTCLTRHEVGTKIEEINGRIAEFTRMLQTYGVQQTATPTQARITYLTAVEDNVVGLEDHVTKVVTHLKDKTHSRIIYIWGIGGLGKTTFSKKIHRRREIEHYFDHIAWVCVSQQCNPHQVWKDILLQLVPAEKDQVRNMTPNELVSKLHSLQMEKKCLVILDDIWKQEDWTSLSPAFPRTTGPGSKIMLTTRNQAVVSHADIQSFPYNLPFLTKEQCMELLEKKVSPEAEGFRMSIEMKNIIEEIVQRCAGLPLAIVLIGGLLAKDKTLDGWNKVRQDLNNCLNQGNDHDGGVRDMLALSYRDMPYYLKSCFLYLSLYPEDHEIEPKSLVQMWIAEGFVSPKEELGSKTMLDVGLSYLNELVNRCMVQAVITQFSNRVKSCRLHDLMGEFCQSMAREENFSEDLNFKHPIPGASSLSKIHRLAVYFSDGQQQQAMIPHEQHQHVRSCLVHNFREGYEVTDHWDKLNSLLKGFNFLKVLSLVDPPNDYCVSEGVLSKDIGKLNHLRYLSIRQRISFPSSLGDLILLQTLDLRVFRRNVIVPDVLWKLKELIHLYLPHFYACSTKLRLDGLSKLETLVNFNTRHTDVKDLYTLPNLRKVHIQCSVKDLTDICEYFMFSKSNGLLRRSSFEIVGNVETPEEHSLLCQVLAYPHVTKFGLNGTVYEETFLHNLSKYITSIQLKKCKLKEDPMPTLGKMPHLRKLTLDEGSYIGKKMECVWAPKKTATETTTSTLTFPQLTYLYIFRLNISEWKVEVGTMPSLSHLTIDCCLELKKIPDGLRFIATLQYLRVVGGSSSLRQRLREGGEDFHII